MCWSVHIGKRRTSLLEVGSAKNPGDVRWFASCSGCRAFLTLLPLCPLSSGGLSMLRTSFCSTRFLALGVHFPPHWMATRSSRSKALFISALCIGTAGALERHANKFAFAGSLGCAVPSPAVSVSQKNAQRCKKAGFAAGALCPARGQRRGSLLSLHACLYLYVFCIVAGLSRVHLC